MTVNDEERKEDTDKHLLVRRSSPISVKYPVEDEQEKLLPVGPGVIFAIQKHLRCHHIDITELMSLLGRRPEYKARNIKIGSCYLTYVGEEDLLAFYDHDISHLPMFTITREGAFDLKTGVGTQYIFDKLLEIETYLKTLIKLNQRD